MNGEIVETEGGFYVYCPQCKNYFVDNSVTKSLFQYNLINAGWLYFGNIGWRCGKCAK